ncbi:uncharacterized protein LOC107359729 isoform X1 [Tetranychus urticae]|uniref:Uncharacterized protein n=1 Tax=Tetranychus urticae TaxID=32264 RepID=T1K2Q5_TETUR|nr:uncharacterized protein LOC107359729 isoform X1 [Tetranychus urticae]
MNFPTVNNPETNSSKHDWPESDIWSEHSYGFAQSRHFRPFGNGAGSLSGVLMVEEPVNERDRTRESPSDTKQLIDIVRELKKSNDELKATNQLLSQKLEQTNQLVQQGFKTIKDALSNIPGQISQNLNTSIVQNSPVGNIDWPILQWTRTSESSSIISSLPEDLADEVDDLTFNNQLQPQPCTSRGLIRSSTDNQEEVKKLAKAMKEKFGFEYDDKLDFDLWLRK